MNPNDPEHCRRWFETIAEMFDCTVREFNFDRKLVDFNGSDENLERLARYIADHTD